MAGVSDTVAFASHNRGALDFLTQSLDMFSKLPSEHRGVVDEDGKIRQVCSTEFLHFLSLELLRARSFAYVQISQPDLDVDQHVRRCQYLQLEFARLLQCPLLFPSPTIKGRFLAILAGDSELCFATACKDLLTEGELRKWDTAWRTICRPNFDVESKGWENFLKNDAPGSGFKPVKTSPKSYLQVLPGVALRIISDLEDEEKELTRFVEQLSAKLEVGSALMLSPTVNLNELDPFSQKKDVKINRQVQMKVVSQPNIHDRLEPRLDYARSTHKLTEFGALMRRVERNPAHPPQPLLASSNFWTAMLLRTWHACEGTEVPKVIESVDEANLEHISEAT